MCKLITCLVALCAVAGFTLADDTADAFTFTIDPPGSTATFPFGIDPQGDIVGNYVAGGHNQGFLLHEGAFTTINVPGATATLARRISPEGDIVGFYFVGSISHGFLLHEGTFTTINFPDATSTLAFGINPQGNIVGWYIDSGGNHGFLLREGAFTSIDFPGHSGATQVFAINPRGDIVGGYNVSPASPPRPAMPSCRLPFDIRRLKCVTGSATAARSRFGDRGSIVLRTKQPGRPGSSDPRASAKRAVPPMAGKPSRVGGDGNQDRTLRAALASFC